MNFRMIRYIMGRLLLIEAALMASGVIVAAIYRDEALTAFVFSILIVLAFGALCCAKKPQNREMYMKDGLVCVALGWVLLSIFGALPFYISGEIPSFIDCIFETVSGFTTTGASILSNVEGLSHSILFWRSFTHWIGGMGILVFALSIIPLAGAQSMYLMRAESPGPVVSKLVPKIKSTAMILYGIYIALTVTEIIFLLCGGVPLFDCFVNSFGTAGTGGFGMYNTSIAHYGSVYVETVITVFMILFGVNFNVYFLILAKQFGKALKSEEVWVYFGILAASCAVITADLVKVYGSVACALRYSSFQVASIMTTTGFFTTDFNLWPSISKTVLVALMVIGACAGSTGGGLKISRLVICFKVAVREIKKMLHPRSVNAVKMDGKPLGDETVNSVAAYFVAYVLIIGVSVLLISADNFDFESSFTAVLSCINNIGPGMAVVGPSGNFGPFSNFTKIILSVDMLIGRLEIYPMLVLVFAPFGLATTRARTR